MIDKENNNNKINAISVITVNILTESIEKYYSEDKLDNKNSKVKEDSKDEKGDKGNCGEDYDQLYKDYSRMRSNTRVNASITGTRAGVDLERKSIVTIYYILIF